MDIVPLRILILEDRVADAELCARELRHGGIQFEMQRVDTRQTFEEALNAYAPDLVISDFSLPSAFDGLAALDIAHAKYPEMPFVFVSGTIGEERAVEAMRKGATDYVLKDRLSRLVPVISRALEEARERLYRREVEHELEKTRDRLDRILSSLTDVIWSLSLQERRFIYVNAAVEDIYGCPAAEFYANPNLRLEFVDHRDQLEVKRKWREALEKDIFEATYRIVRRDGSVRWIQDRAHVIHDANGNPLQIDGLARDITESMRQQERIGRLSRIQAMLSGINSAIVRIRDRAQLFEEACRIAVEHGKFRMAYISLLDSESGNVLPQAWAGHEDGFLKEPKNISGVRRTGIMAKALLQRMPVTRNDIEADYTMTRRDKALARGYRSEVVLPLIVNDREYGVMCIFAEEAGFFDEQELRLLLELTADVSFALEYIEKEEKLNYIAYYDVITGLPNRSLFHDRVMQRVSSAQSERTSFFVFMFDVERFRQINETLGRHAGDDLLRQLAQRLRTILLPTDIVAHFDGDYFAVATRRTEEDGDVAHMLDNILRGTSSEPFLIGGNELRLATRAGIAAYPADGSTVDVLLSNAEAALKDAKRTGQRYMFYASQMNARVAEQMKLETELRRAVLEEQFVLFYQPRVDITTGRISGLEALIRWNHTERGLVPPNDFIPMLESTGLIVDVGQWALRRAALDYRKWRDEGLNPPRIAVNVSQGQLRHKDFVAAVAEALGAAGEYRDQMDIEITESMLMENIDNNIARLRAVQAMGVQIAMDDFGTGYSSLSYLARLPINSLKIDRSFVSEMNQGPEQMAIVSTVISLGRALNLKVVAEGVETDEQKNLLRLLKCDEIQGYLFSPPLPVEKIEAMLRAALGK